jgi:tRNA G18 (ribose-2'-O)-methylase SpoU
VSLLARMSPPIEIDDPGDERLADYRRLKERHLNAEGGRFVAESERVVRRLLGSGLPVHSVLLTAPRLATLADALSGPFPVFLASQATLDAIAGFHVHRGCLAIGGRPPPQPLPRDARVVVALEDLTDVDNLGALARHAAAFGADALVLSPRCADPFYRKAVRVSLGAVFSVPIVRATRWPDDLAALRGAGLALVGAVVDQRVERSPASPGGAHRGRVWEPSEGSHLDERATSLGAFRPPGRFALLLGAEGPGLSAAARAACDHLVTIPMSPGADSLNVATAGAIFLYALTRSS